MSRKLADLFRESRGKPIVLAGREVHMMYEFAGPAAQDELSIRFAPPSPARDQALRIRADGGLLEVNGQALEDVVLWSDSTPELVVVGFQPAGDKMSLRIWNAWRDPAGTMQAWIGNAGILVEHHHGSTVLRCSDGFDDPTFDDLVATLTLGPSNRIRGDSEWNSHHPPT